MKTAGVVWVAMVALTLTSAAVLAELPGTERLVGALVLPPPPRPADVAAIAVANALALAPALAGLSPWRRLRLAALGVIAAKGVLGCVMVGAVLTEHGDDSLRWLVHVPVEWAAVAVAIGACRRPRLLALGVAGTVAAAALEVYATPHW